MNRPSALALSFPRRDMLELSKNGRFVLGCLVLVLVSGCPPLRLPVASPLTVPPTEVDDIFRCTRTLTVTLPFLLMTLTSKRLADMQARPPLCVMWKECLTMSTMSGAKVSPVVLALLSGLGIAARILPRALTTLLQETLSECSVLVVTFLLLPVSVSSRRLAFIPPERRLSVLRPVTDTIPCV